jgi:hypothetical protein
MRLSFTVTSLPWFLIHPPKRVAYSTPTLPIALNHDVQSVNYLDTALIDFCLSETSSSSELTRFLPATLDAGCID